MIGRASPGYPEKVIGAVDEPDRPFMLKGA
jgi:hypothetical protein